MYNHNSGLSGDGCYFMYLNGQLYRRAKNSDEKPFELINTETLEEISENEAFNKKIESIKKKKKEETEAEGDKEEEKKEEVVEEDSKEPDNTPHLTWTSEEDAEEKKPGRYL